MRALGVIDLPTIQKKLNLHYSLSLDLFGSEVSTNAANAFNAGIKGRFRETAIEDDHRLENSTYPVLKLVDGEIKRVDEPALTALNMRLRDDYTARLRQGHRALEQDHRAHRRRLPAGAAACRVPPPDRRVQGRAGDAAGVLIDEATWSREKDKWLPSAADGDFIALADEAGERARQVRVAGSRRPRSASTTGRATSNT